MSMINLILVSTVIFLTSCSSGSNNVVDKGVDRRYDRLFIKKQQAPIEISTLVKKETAHVDLSFLEEAHEVNILVYGIGGLEIAGESFSLYKEKFEKLEKKSIDVQIQNWVAGSYLVISISALFNKKKMAKIETVAILDETKRTIYRPSPLGPNQLLKKDSKGDLIIVSKLISQSTPH